MWNFKRAPVLLSLIGFSPLTGTAQDLRLMKAGDLVRIGIVEGLPYSHSVEGPKVGAGSLLIGKVRSVSDVVVLREEKAAIAGSALGVIGGIFGLFAGALTESEIWEDVGVSVLKASLHKGRGFGVGLSLPVGTW